MSHVSLYRYYVILILFMFTSCDKLNDAWNLKKAPQVSDWIEIVNGVESFRLKSNCKSIGFDKDVKMGFCWSYENNPTIDDNIILSEKKDTGDFETEVPWTEITTKNFRAFVSNEITTVYSDNFSVTFPGENSLATVQTINVTQITFNSFNANCAVINTFGNPIIEKGVFVFTDLSNPIPSQTITSTTQSSTYTVNINSLIDGSTYYIQAYVKTISGVSLGNTLTVTTPKIYQIGQVGPAGGRIIYENPNPFGPWHYLEVAPIDISGNFVWAPNLSQTKVIGVGLGEGAANTDEIVFLFQSSNYSAYQALIWTYNGFSDWFLPSLNELMLMKQSLFDQNQNIGNFTNGASYWSSSEDAVYSSNAWAVIMQLSGQNIITTKPKNEMLRIRAIRRF